MGTFAPDAYTLEVLPTALPPWLFQVSVMVLAVHCA